MPFVANEKGSMVVVVTWGVNGSKAIVVVAVGTSLELIGKGMEGGGGRKHLLHTTALCPEKYGKLCANILRSMSTQHPPNQYHYVFSLLT